MLGLAEKFVMKETELHKRVVRRGETLREQLNTLLADDGVLIYPSHPSPAPYHNQLLLKPFNFAYTGIFNILGNPVTQVTTSILSLSALTRVVPRCPWASIARGCLSGSRLWPGGTWTGSVWLWLRRFSRCSVGGFHPRHVRIRDKSNSHNKSS